MLTVLQAPPDTGYFLFVGESRAREWHRRYVPKKEFFTRPMTLAMSHQGPGCFNEQYYMQRNKVIEATEALSDAHETGAGL
jgi:hypothetical protein